MSELKREGEVFIFRMTDGENRLNARFLEAFHGALDAVDAVGGAAALVTTGEGKFYSNGLDLTWMSSPECTDRVAFIDGVQTLYARLLGFRRPTVAALNGHTFAAGAMLALAHDACVMRGDRGFFCLPEVDINIPFTTGMSALLKARLTPAVLNEACTTGRRYGGNDAKLAGIVLDACDEHEVVKRAVARAQELAGKDPTTLGAIKKGLYADALRALGTSAAASER